uniref:Uncharacterized protein n=1 Tax=Anguilla anguilla TaxID=7936 RepID=A0A0E9RGG1_ANGAN
MLWHKHKAERYGMWDESVLFSRSSELISRQGVFSIPEMSDRQPP